MAYPTKAVANAFLEIAQREGKPVTPMKLQKLVYFAHGWYLALTGGAPLIDEQVEAWQYGPVVPSLYHEFKVYGNQPIKSLALDYAFGAHGDFTHCAPKIPDDEELTAFLERVWEVYGEFTPIQLSNMTHEPDTPWSQTRGNDGVPKSTDIPNNRIQGYFEKLRAENESAD